MIALIYFIVFFGTIGIMSQVSSEFTPMGMLTAYLITIVISPLIRVLFMKSESAAQYKNGKTGYFVSMLGKGIIWPLLLIKKIIDLIM